MGGYGNYLVINHGNGFETLYAHLSQIRVIAGQGVQRGQVIGLVGRTGRSTGPHLHFEIRQGGVKRNPFGFLPRG
jgi:murein DD-endopeptidase MepM/ murein hydrolase activator NlpD